MNPTGGPTSETEYVLRRLGESFPQFEADAWGSFPKWLLLAAGGLVVAFVAHRLAGGARHRAATPAMPVRWLRWAGPVAMVLGVFASEAYFYRIADFPFRSLFAWPFDLTSWMAALFTLAPPLLALLPVVVLLPVWGDDGVRHRSPVEVLLRAWTGAAAWLLLVTFMDRLFLRDVLRGVAADASAEWGAVNAGVWLFLTGAALAVGWALVTTLYAGDLGERYHSKGLAFLYLLLGLLAYAAGLAVLCGGYFAGDWLLKGHAPASAWGIVLPCYAITVGVTVGLMAVMHLAGARSANVYWATLLVTTRMCVYAALMAVFLLPAVQTWERTEKKSRVLVLLDVSPSVVNVSDDVSSAPGRVGKTRIDKVIDFLTDDKVAFFAKLMEKNPVYVYRFGSRLDDETAELKAGDPAMPRTDWEAFARYDFKPFALRGLSEAGQRAVRDTADWGGDKPGTADWASGWVKNEAAVPGGLAEADLQTFKDNRAKLDKRIDVARSIVSGTNVADALTAAINREAANMVQGVIVFTDGRSNLGSDAALQELKARAERENVPVFTVAVGEDRQTVGITITDVVAQDRAPPDEPFKIVVEADGVNLANQEVEVKLGLYLPTRDPKKDPPDHELTAKLTFLPGDPPHGQAEFVIDPAKLPEALTEEGKDGAIKKRQLKEGTWAAVARIAKDKREVFADAEHVRERPGIQVIKKPLRVLMVASGPTREFQTLKTLLVRETQQNRAELSIYLQSEGGTTGMAVLDVPPERLLVRFPTHLNTTDKGKPDERFYNLNEYDLIIAFDPDWSELSEQQVKNVQNWVDNLGGGLIFVADSLHTFQLARAEANSRLSPILDILPVIPDDIIVIQARPFPKTPRRLYLKPLPESDLLRLDEEAPADPMAGWERFFTDRDRYSVSADIKQELFPHRGFFRSYPVKAVKPGATVLAEFGDVDDKGEKKLLPWLVTTQPARGRTAYLASGETYRLRALDPKLGPEFYERFWIKLTRYIAANRDVKASRGRVLLAKEYVSGSPVRVQARLLGPNGEPYPVGAIDPKFRIVPYTANGEPVEREDPNTKQKVKVELGPYLLTAKKGASGFDGYYQGQVLADARQFPPGDTRYRVVIEVPDSAAETIEGEFAVRKSDPEMDNTRPDFAALLAASGEFDKAIQDRVTDPVTKAALLDKLPKEGGKSKLAFRLTDPDGVGLIPACLKAEERNFRNRGPVKDLWDAGVTVPPVETRWGTVGGGQIAYVLLVVVGLLSWEWITRKLLRLA